MCAQLLTATKSGGVLRSSKSTHSKRLPIDVPGLLAEFLGDDLRAGVHGQALLLNRAGGSTPHETNRLSLVCNVVIVLGASQLCGDLGKDRTADSQTHTDGLHEQLITARDEISILLSLMFRFTLAIVLSRFDLRKRFQWKR